MAEGAASAADGAGVNYKGVVRSFTVHYDCVKCCSRIFNGAEKPASRARAGQSAEVTTTYLVVAELLPGPLLLQPEGGREATSAVRESAFFEKQISCRGTQEERGGVKRCI